MSVTLLLDMCLSMRLYPSAPAPCIACTYSMKRLISFQLTWKSRRRTFMWYNFGIIISTSTCHSKAKRRMCICVLEPTSVMYLDTITGITLMLRLLPLCSSPINIILFLQDLCTCSTCRAGALFIRQNPVSPLIPRPYIQYLCSLLSADSQNQDQPSAETYEQSMLQK